MYRNGVKCFSTIHSEILSEQKTETQQEVKWCKWRHTHGEKWEVRKQVFLKGISNGSNQFPVFQINPSKHSLYICPYNRYLLNASYHFIEGLLLDESGAQGRKRGQKPKSGCILPCICEPVRAHLGKE